MITKICALILAGICSTLGALELESAAFGQGDTIPIRYTCEGADLSPPLVWQGAPQDTKSFVLICVDPDAPSGTCIHWLLFNLPPDTTQLHEGLFNREALPNGALQGINSFGHVGYQGPCPPPGPGHRYIFTLYALDSMLQLTNSASKAQIDAAMHGHILAQSELVGTYSLSKKQN